MFNDIQLVDDDKIKNDNFEKSLEFQKKWNEKASKERNEVIKLIKEILI